MTAGKLSAGELFVATIVDARSLFSRVVSPEMRRDVTLRGDIERYLDATSAFAERDGKWSHEHLTEAVEILERYSKRSVGSDYEDAHIFLAKLGHPGHEPWAKREGPSK